MVQVLQRRAYSRVPAASRSRAERYEARLCRFTRTQGASKERVRLNGMRESPVCARYGVRCTRKTRSACFMSPVVLSPRYAYHP